MSCTSSTQSGRRKLEKIYPDVDKLMSDVKKMFVKARLRVQKFKQDAPSMSVLGFGAHGWMPWCIIVKKYSTTENTVSDFDSNEAPSTKIVKDFFSQQFVRKPGLYKVKLWRHINHNFSPGKSWCRNAWCFVLVKSTECEAGHTRGKVGDSVKFKQLCNILQNKRHSKRKWSYTGRTWTSAEQLWFNPF
jgi:hypothetical protein